MSQRIITLTDRYDALARNAEQDTIDRINRALEGNYDQLTKKLLSNYDEYSSRAELIEAARLLQLQADLGEVLGIVPTDQRLTATYEKLYRDLEEIGGEYAAEVLREIGGPAELAKFSALPLEAVAYAATDSAKRLQQHGETFAENAARTISAGIAQGVPYRAVAQSLLPLKDLTKYQAERIARTEGNRVMVDAAKTRYEQRGVQYGRWLSAGDERACPFCGARNGLIFELKSMVMPSHVSCRCSVLCVKPEWGDANNQDFWNDYREEGLEQLREAGRSPNMNPSPFETVPPSPIPFRALKPSKPPVPTPDPVPEPIQEPGPEPVPEPQPVPAPILEDPPIPIDPELGRKRYTDVIERGKVQAAKFTDPAEMRSLRNNYLEFNSQYYQALTDRGEFIKGVKNPLKPTKKQKAELDRLEVLINESFESKTRTLNTIRDRMGLLREGLLESGLDRPSAFRLAQVIDIYEDMEESELPPGTMSKAKVREELVNLFQLTGGRGSKRLSEIIREDDRAWASKSGTLNIGRMISDSDLTILWHEVGHFAEYEDLTLGETNLDWIISRSDRRGPEKLSVLTGLGYEDYEVAFVTDFDNPYLGKLYAKGSQQATEVLAMGLERFRSADDMARLFVDDQDHFFITLGAIR